MKRIRFNDFSCFRTEASVLVLNRHTDGAWGQILQRVGQRAVFGFHQSQSTCPADALHRQHAICIGSTGNSGCRQNQLNGIRLNDQLRIRTHFASGLIHRGHYIRTRRYVKARVELKGRSGRIHLATQGAGTTGCVFYTNRSVGLTVACHILNDDIEQYAIRRHHLEG